MNILLEEVVGWDLEKHCKTENQGYFGNVKALNFAIEEQGRQTLHVHMLLWIEQLDKLQEDVAIDKSSQAKNILYAYGNHLATTRLFPTDIRDLQKLFDHECIGGRTTRRNFTPPDV